MQEMNKIASKNHYHGACSSHANQPSNWDLARSVVALQSARCEHLSGFRLTLARSGVGRSLSNPWPSSGRRLRHPEQHEGPIRTTVIREFDVHPLRACLAQHKHQLAEVVEVHLHLRVLVGGLCGRQWGG